MGIWEDVLKVRPIGLQENFFHLGGHSLLATQVIARLQSAFAVEIPILRLFAEPTIAGLTQAVEQALRQQQFLSLPPLRPAERTQPLPLSFAQQRLWVLDRLEPGSVAYNKPIALHLRGPLQRAVLARSLDAIVERHEVLRTTFVETDSGPLQRIGVASELVVIQVDLNGLAPQEREPAARELARQEAGMPFDLARGPLFRRAILRLDEQEHVVLLTMHHIVSDGWSNGVMIGELVRLYRALMQGQSAALAPLPVQYADYALWQRSWLQGETLERLLDYWQRTLAGVPTLELPTDHPRPGVPTLRGRLSLRYSR